MQKNTCERHGPKDKAILSLALSKVCILQKQYGKTSAELQVLVEGFLWVLADYPMEEILAALGKYIQKNTDIPAPANIIEIIEMTRLLRNPGDISGYEEQSVEALIEYQNKRIPLTPKQQERLDIYYKNKEGNWP